MELIEMEQQRRIGKQLMIVNIIKNESAKVRKGGCSFIDRSQVAAWAEISEEEMETLYEQYNLLNPYNIARAAAKEYTKEMSVDYCVFFSMFFYKMSGMAFMSSIGENRNYYEKYVNKVVDDVFEIDELDISEETYSIAALSKALSYFQEYVIVNINKELNAGLDVAVAKSMLGDLWSSRLFAEMKVYEYDED